MERQKMRKKGFTLVELLVVIAIIAMLLAILMPALSKVRQLAQRLMCGTNLAGVGKAMLSYTNEDKYERFPIAGSPGAAWDHGTGGKEGENSFDWRNPKPFPETGTDPTITISANLYLLVKYADVAPDQFVCPGTDQKEFELGLYDMTGYLTATIVDVWDFGQRGTGLGGEKSPPGNTRGKGHMSYSYQSPVKFDAARNVANHKAFPITTRSNPRRPVMADRNPFWQLPIDNTSTARKLHWDPTNQEVYAPSIANANSQNHQKEGQNVLFADLHASFEKASNCGIDLDNIYTVWGTTRVPGDTDLDKWRQCGDAAPDIPMGNTTGRMIPSQQASAGTYYPMYEQDTYLVSDLDG